MDDIRYYSDPSNAFKNLEDFKKDHPNAACRIMQYKDNSEANEGYQKWIAEAAKLSKNVLNKLHGQVIDLVDDDDCSSTLSTDVEDGKEDDKKPSKKMPEEPAKNSSLAMIDPQQLDNAGGFFYVLITKKDTTFYHSSALLQAAFEDVKSKNPYQHAWMKCCKDKYEVEQEKLSFHKKFGTVAYIEPSPTKEPPQNNQQQILDMIMESKDVQFFQKIQDSLDCKIPAAKKAKTLFSAANSHKMPEKQHMVKSEDSLQPMVSYDGNRFIVDPLVVSICLNKIDMHVTVLHPGEIHNWTEESEYDKYMVVIDLCFKSHYGVKMNSFWLFKPTYFQALTFDKQCDANRNPDLVNMRRTFQRASPFGESTPLVHAKKDKSFNHELLVTWVHKQPNKSVEVQVKEFLDDFASLIMQPKLQKTFQRVVMAYSSGGKFSAYFKPLDQVEEGDVNNSLWVNMYAGLKNPIITYDNRLKRQFLDDEIPTLVPNFFSDADNVPPRSMWTNEFQEFVFGDETIADM